jgi:hypothetical protein
MIADPFFYVAAVPAVILLGLSKGGFAGVGALSLPLLMFVTDPVRAAAILLPLLIVQDAVGVWAFRRTVDRFVLAWTLPGATLGIVGGYVFASAVSPAAVMAAVGGISALFGAYRLWGERRIVTAPADLSRAARSGPIGLCAGVAAGFTSQIAHAGGPPFQLWVLPRRLSPPMLAGTTAVFFGIVNWMKVPAYWALGQFTQTNLIAAASLMPVAIASTFAGVWLVRRIDARRFYTIIYLLMIATGAKLMWDGLR